MYTPPPPTSGKGAKAVLAMIAAVALVALGAGAGAAAFDDGPVYPDRWDPRVADIATFVEDHRGHRFEHPVQIYFLSVDRYREIAGGGPDRPAPTPEEAEYSAHTVAEYRALGLMQGSPDLNAATETLQDSGTLAFCSPEDDVVNVRGTEITPAVRVTLAHELTHALQDQYFDLSPIADATTADESGAARAVVEGDAVSVENAYIASMSDADVASYEAESDASGTQADTDLAEVPAVLQVLFGSYYAVGNAFVEFWQADPSGTAELDNIDEVLRDLPSGSHQLFEPLLYSTGTDRDYAESPRLPDGEEEFERSIHGVDLLFVMLAERIDPVTALAATDGWRADSYVASLDTDDRMCVRSTVSFATADDSSQFIVAITAWSQTMPADADIVIDPISGDQLSVGFTTCDAGPDADMHLTGNAGPALGFPVTRLQAAAAGVSEGRSRENALCYGQAIVSKLTIEDMTATERTPAIDAAITAAEAACP